ncbi:MAG: hypothetical protein EZS28_011598 [Streblomastix strix]|uniref:Uncharacterized protein n=1 Tax=Streblomastix strix TaxID=222440 RepID=A0A5J4WEZ1_9EUKA|nr:MAG: hypothetical protein EZS28_011598 [Streblomastix strix]
MPKSKESKKRRQARKRQRQEKELEENERKLAEIDNDGSTDTNQNQTNQLKNIIEQMEIISILEYLPAEMINLLQSTATSGLLRAVLSCAEASTRLAGAKSLRTLIDKFGTILVPIIIQCNLFELFEIFLGPDLAHYLDVLERNRVEKQTQIQTQGNNQTDFFVEILLIVEEICTLSPEITERIVKQKPDIVHSLLVSLLPGKNIPEKLAQSAGSLLSVLTEEGKYSC